MLRERRVFFVFISSSEISCCSLRYVFPQRDLAILWRGLFVQHELHLLEERPVVFGGASTLGRRVEHSKEAAAELSRTVVEKDQVDVRSQEVQQAERSQDVDPNRIGTQAEGAKLNVLEGVERI